MKFTIIAFFALTLSSLSFAQTSGSGEIVIGNGQTTVGIRIGNPAPTNAQLIERVLKLERAVQDLQIKVYNLTASDLPGRSLFECSIEAFGKMYYGQGETQNMAISNAKKSCLTKHSSMFCEETKCSQLK